MAGIRDLLSSEEIEEGALLSVEIITFVLEKIDFNKSENKPRELMKAHLSCAYAAHELKELSGKYSRGEL